MTIINIRGTSGSGKSTLIRKVLENYGAKTAYKEEGRKQPIGYVYKHKNPELPSLAVIGHYETPCGGCDTIPNMEKIFSLVREAHKAGHDVIYEGLLISADIKRTAELLAEGLPLIIVALSTPIELCLESINLRRRAKDPNKPDVPAKNTISKHKGVQNSVKKLQALGARVAWCDRNVALQTIVAELKAWNK